MHILVRVSANNGIIAAPQAMLGAESIQQCFVVHDSRYFFGCDVVQLWQAGACCVYDDEVALTFC